MESEPTTRLEMLLQSQNGTLERILEQLNVIVEEMAAMKLVICKSAEASDAGLEPSELGEPEHADEVDAGNF